MMIRRVFVSVRHRGSYGYKKSMDYFRCPQNCLKTKER